MEKEISIDLLIKAIAYYDKEMKVLGLPSSKDLKKNYQSIEVYPVMGPDNKFVGIIIDLIENETPDKT